MFAGVRVGRRVPSVLVVGGATVLKEKDLSEMCACSRVRAERRARSVARRLGRRAQAADRWPVHPGVVCIGLVLALASVLAVVVVMLDLVT